jgi:hypothetical protein
MRKAHGAVLAPGAQSRPWQTLLLVLQSARSARGRVVQKVDLCALGASASLRSAMPGFGQFCPVAVTCEIFAQWWTPIILRVLLAGSHRFNQLQRGIPRIPRALLARRLRELEAAGVVTSTPLSAGRGRELCAHRRRRGTPHRDRGARHVGTTLDSTRGPASSRCRAPDVEHAQACCRGPLAAASRRRAVRLHGRARRVSWPQDVLAAARATRT